jgi:prophage regulatory protein
MAEQIRAALAILRRKQVEARTGLSRSTIYQRVADGTFPKPVNIGVRAVGWVESEVTDWLNSQVQQSRSSTSTAK